MAVVMPVRRDEMVETASAPPDVAAVWIAVMSVERVVVNVPMMAVRVSPRPALASKAAASSLLAISADSAFGAASGMAMAKEARVKI